MGRPKKTETTTPSKNKENKSKAKSPGRPKSTSSKGGRKEKIHANVRTAVWNTYVGREKGEDKCFIGCGEPITRANFQCGHIQAEARGGKVTIQNLRPICPGCNTSIGTRNMVEFMDEKGFKKHKNWDKNLLDEKKRWLKIPFIN